MKTILMLLGVGLAGAAGYLVEPSLRTTLTGWRAPASKPDKPQDDPSKIDLSSIPQARLPKEVTLLSEIQLTDELSGLSMTVRAGGTARVARVEGDHVIVRPGTTAYTVSVPVSQTDLLERIASAPPPEPEPEPAPVPQPEPAPIPQPVPQPAPEPAPVAEPTPAPEPTPIPAPEPQPVPEPAPVPAPQPTPDPIPEPATPAPAPQPATSCVPIMRLSLQNGEIKEFTIAQVREWKDEPTETVENETFQVGSVTYESETIFGRKVIPAKAYIRDGKVVRWIWPKSGLQIR